MNFLELWNKYKLWLAPFVAIFMWLISMVCFVFGLSFKNPIVVMGFDATLWIAFGLSISNTIIQVIGNGMKLEKDTDGVFFWIWIASYALGISSNTNTLLQILGIDSKALEWTIALALGAMIEIAPEKMIVMWLKSIVPSKKPTWQGNNHQQNKGNSNRPWTPTYPSVNFGHGKGGGQDRRKELEKNRNDGLARLAKEVMREESVKQHPFGE